MRILHLFSNWKWTGPAEPALNVAWRQCADHEVLFLSGEPSEGAQSRIVPEAESRGVPHRAGFLLGKHARFRANREDARRLAGLLEEFRPEIVHAHMDNDHRIASMAVARTGIGHLVRTAYDARGLSGGFRTRRVARRAMDGLIVNSRTAFDTTLHQYGGSASSVSVGGIPRPMTLIEGGVDLVRFDSRRFDRTAGRERIGLAPDDVGIGIVARVQGHRRFEILLEAHARIVRRHPQLKLVVIGRGTHIKALLLDPIERMGLAGSVISTGYLKHDEYPSALAGLDASLFLVPGSDGTCRALREQMAMGLPSIVTPRAPLPDIVEEGSSGLVVEESADGLAAGLERMVAEPDLRARMGQGAADAARRRFDIDSQAAATTAFYGTVIEAARTGPAGAASR